MLPRILLLSITFFITASVLGAAVAHAQDVDSRTGELAVEIRDALGGVLPGATVTVSSQAAADGPMAVSDARGRAELSDLAPGRYRVVVELPGFDPAIVTDVEIAAGRTTSRAVTLEIAGLAEHVTVQVDEGEQRLTDSFTETLSAEEIDQLPDDPEEAMTLLEQLAGPGAEIRVNGFEDDRLPPKAQIQAIRIRQDPFAPDSRGAGRPRVEIITRPGTSDWEHDLNIGLRDQSIDARNAFADERGRGQTRRVRWSSSGPLVKDRTSISFELSARDAFELQPIVATRLDGPVNGSVNQQNTSLNAEVRLEHAVTPTHTLRVEYHRRGRSGNNLGVGEFSLPERAYDTTNTSDFVRVSTSGTFGKTAFNEFRLESVWRRDERSSRSDAVTVNVESAFTAGGAQLEGGTREYEIEIGDDLELAIGKRHKVRAGFEGEFGRIRSNRIENAAGRFVFPGLDAYAAGQPIQFVQRIGDPSIAYNRYEMGWYVYDEYRPRKNVQLGLGVRHEFQSFTGDWANFGPRASLAWSPAAVKGTTFRAGAGLFYDWYDASLHEQTLRLDGERQRDLIVTDPGWPDPFAGTGGIELPPPSVVRASRDIRLPTTRRVSVGVQQQVGRGIDLRVNVFDESTWNRLRSVDVNAPIEGVRPNPALGRVTEIRSTGEAEERGVETSVRLRSSEGGFFGTVRYRYARAFNDADGALSLPTDSRNPGVDWGPASDDVRHRLFGYVRASAPHGIRIGLSTRVSSGSPYTIRTGFDDNGDAVPNDRPAGVGRNTERGEWHAVTDLRLGWMMLGEPQRGGRSEARGRGHERNLEIYAQISNLFNRTNYTRYTGVLTSDFFGEPTAAQPGRRFELGLRMSL
jgi:hypothetical protein